MRPSKPQVVADLLPRMPSRRTDDPTLRNSFGPASLQTCAAFRWLGRVEPHVGLGLPVVICPKRSGRRSGLDGCEGRRPTSESNPNTLQAGRGPPARRAERPPLMSLQRCQPCWSAVVRNLGADKAGYGCCCPQVGVGQWGDPE